MMSPYLQRPLELGVDIVYDSGTKYLSGHHDLMAGVAIARTEEIGKVSFIFNVLIEIEMCGEGRDEGRGRGVG